MKKPTHILVIVFLAVLFFAQEQASANYILQEPKKRFLLITWSWQLVEEAARNPINSALGGPERILRVKQAGKTYEWSINRMWLAHNVDSNSICTGNYMKLTDEYLTKVGSQKNKPLAIVLLDVTGRSNFFVGNLAIFDPKENFPKASSYGSNLLDLTPEQVKALNTAQGYEDKAIDISNKNWAELKKLSP